MSKKKKRIKITVHGKEIDKIWMGETNKYQSIGLTSDDNNIHISLPKDKNDTSIGPHITYPKENRHEDIDNKKLLLELYEKNVNLKDLTLEKFKEMHPDGA